MAGNKNMIQAEKNAAMIAKQKANAQSQYELLASIFNIDQDKEVLGYINTLIKIAKNLEDRTNWTTKIFEEQFADGTQSLIKLNKIFPVFKTRLEQYNKNCFDPKLRVDIRSFTWLTNYSSFDNNITQFLLPLDRYSAMTKSPDTAWHIKAVQSTIWKSAKETQELLKTFRAQYESFFIQIENRVEYYKKII